MAAIYSNGGNRWNILGFNFTKRDALSSKWCKPENERKSHSKMTMTPVTLSILRRIVACLLAFTWLAPPTLHLRVSNHLKEHIILYNPIEYRAWNSYI